MVDFAKKLGKAVAAKQLEPSKIYESLDRASDKGPLRPAQSAILDQWHASHRADRDLIVKLQTGQGKTLVGLLILQSKINEGVGPAVYLCADRFLVQQTVKQAKEFGFKNIVSEPDSEDFLASRAIMITTVDKMFNGLSQFKLRAQSLLVGVVLMDDAHACSDSIRQAFTISLPKGHDCYEAILDLFADDLELQGPGTLTEIRNGSFDAILPVPYWSWQEKHSDVVRFLAKRTEENKIKFPWALIKDDLAECQCVISGGWMEIAPRLPRLEVFGSYWKAKHRVFMSATITNDAFLIKGLNIDPSAIKEPLTFAGEKWYGEKMVLIPSLIDEEMTRDVVVAHLGKPNPRRKGGFVALTPSFKAQASWVKAGAEAVDRSTIGNGIQRLYDGNYAVTLALANKYDGIDLPDNACRVLIIDGKPFSEGLLDRYQDSCRSGSETTLLKEARSIEQGMGRGVRGQRDYCVVILIGPTLIRAMRTGQSRSNFSDMTHKQIEIGMNVADMAKDEVREGIAPLSVLDGLVNQCLDRNEGWKVFYSEQMDTIAVKVTLPALLEVFAAELEAETAYQDGYPQAAMDKLQAMIDAFVPSGNNDDRGWYLQEMARFLYSTNASEANKLQIAAHKQNKLVMRPKSGMVIEKLIVSQQRVENIKKWILQFESNEALVLAVEEICSSLSFGKHADDFESALHKMGMALGFACQRPDKEWREGPDNLWALRDGHYLIFECKSEVESDRDHIYKSETGQMNNSCAWFKKNYPNAVAKRIMIIPTKKIGDGAGFNDPVEIMRRSKLKDFVKRFKALFQELKQLDLKDISDARIQEAIRQNKVGIDNLLGDYSELPVST